MNLDRLPNRRVRGEDSSSSNLYHVPKFMDTLNNQAILQDTYDNSVIQMR